MKTNTLHVAEEEQVLKSSLEKVFSKEVLIMEI
jgi:hypothetical protein